MANSAFIHSCSCNRTDPSVAKRVHKERTPAAPRAGARLPAATRMTDRTWSEGRASSPTRVPYQGDLLGQKYK